jgi:HPt (histidine-containing phosphotransfer) domain-containing protein
VSDPNVCDLAAALRSIEGDRDLLLRMNEAFLSETPMLLEDTREAIAGNDAHGLERGAHTLKGSVSNFAARPVYETAAELEDIGRRGDWRHAANVHARLQRQLDDLVDVLVGYTQGAPL